MRRKKLQQSKYFYSIPILSLPDFKHNTLNFYVEYHYILNPYSKIRIFNAKDYIILVLWKSSAHLGSISKYFKNEYSKVPSKMVFKEQAPAHLTPVSKYLLKIDLDSNPRLILNEEQDILIPTYAFIEDWRLERNQKYSGDAYLVYPCLLNNPFAAIFASNPKTYEFAGSLFCIDSFLYSKTSITMTEFSPVFTPLESIWRETSIFKGLQFKDSSLLLTGRISDNYSLATCIRYMSPYLILDINSDKALFNLNEQFKSCTYFDMQLNTIFLMYGCRPTFYAFSEIDEFGNILFSYFLHTFFIKLVLTALNHVKSTACFQEFFNKLVETICKINNIDSDLKEIVFKLLLRATANVYRESFMPWASNTLDITLTDDYFIVRRRPNVTYQDKNPFNIVFDMNLSMAPFSEQFFDYCNSNFFMRPIINTFENKLVFQHQPAFNL